MQTKDITKALGIPRERIKYYKKERVFIPENPVFDGKTDYTERDFANLKRLVILTKSGLSCADIRKVQAGAKSLQEVINERRIAIFEKMERMKGTLSLSEELLKGNAQYESLPMEVYWNLILYKEQAGEEFMDIDDGYYPVPLFRKIRCPHCGEEDEVDLEDFLYDQSSYEKENGMGPDIVYSFNSEDSYECPKCGKVLQIEGWIREYPVGAFDSDEVNINDWED